MRWPSKGSSRRSSARKRYLAAGADVLFVEALRSRSGHARRGSALRGRVPAARQHGGGRQDAVLPVADLERLGFSIAIFPGGTARAAAFAFAEYFASLKAHGTTAPYRGRMIDFDALQQLLGTADMLALGKRYDDSSA